MQLLLRLDAVRAPWQKRKQRVLHATSDLNASDPHSADALIANTLGAPGGTRSVPPCDQHKRTPNVSRMEHQSGVVCERTTATQPQADERNHTVGTTM